MTMEVGSAENVVEESVVVATSSGTFFEENNINPKKFSTNALNDNTSVGTSSGAFLCGQNSPKKLEIDALIVKTSCGIFSCDENCRLQFTNDIYMAKKFGFEAAYDIDGVCPWQQTFNYMNKISK